MQINISEIISTDYKVQTFNPEIEMEAFCLDGQADIFHPYEKHHSTVKNACEFAEELHVKNLLLYHTEDRNLSHRKELYYEEGRKYFSGNLLIPDDLETFII